MKPFDHIDAKTIDEAASLLKNNNAIGVRIMDYPFTPDKVIKALGKAK